MGIMNRRNAMLGWATWAVIKRVLKRNAKAEVEAVAEGAKRRFRRGKDQVVEEAAEPKKKTRSKRRVLGFLAATAVGVGAWLKARGGRGGEPVE
jgi:hypothetical protein